MLAPLTIVFTIILVLLNLIGLALAATRLTGSYALARIASPLAFALVMFFCEHFVGFGSLRFLWPITTVASIWLCVRQRDLLRAEWRVEAIALAAFAWVLAWRIAFPGLVASSEKIGDLAMISSYLPGDRLPPPDAWLPPFRFDVYYAFQHYAAALLGRIFDLSPGLTYNVAFCVLVSLTIAAAALCARLICRSTAGTALVVLAFAAGGTGASLPVHAMLQRTELYSSMRFIGGTATPGNAETAIGRAIVQAAGVASRPVLELPSETFAYLLALGDYHAPLSGFYLLMLALLCMALVERGIAVHAAQALIAATPVLCIISDGWTLPLQAALVLAWIAYRVHRGTPPDWRMLAAGVFGAAMLCHPFLNTFTYRSVHYAVKLRVVPESERTPLLLAAILLYPIVAAAILPVLFGERRRWILWSSSLWLALLAISECFYIDDVYSGQFNRFNTTLKWWPWIQAGALVTAGAYGMGSASRVLRAGTAVVLSLVTVFAVDMAKQLVWAPKPEIGRLDGAAWISRDPVERGVLEFLQAQPRGIVLQRPEAGAFTPAPALILFAGQTAFLGWSEHEKLWRGQRVDVELRARDVAAFYRGELQDSLRWLRYHQIDHVLWLKTEATMPPAAFAKIDEQIRGGYVWQELYRAGEFRVGVWSRAGVRDGAAASWRR